ncbi:MAG: tRNA (N(6)-L-threonylcarbamoyladenosine(37)-C(2))-methylthiotransferase MtaB [Myxococcota bacterium]
MGRRFAIQTFGCRVNQSDSTRLARDLEASAWSRVQDPDHAELVVLNTCTVTHRSDADVRKAVHRIQRTRPGTKVLVTGCMAQRAPDQLVQLGVHGVLGNSDKTRIAELSERLWRGTRDPIVVHHPMEAEAPQVDPMGGVLDRSRPFVKIQDGCDAHCTYCIIPEVRGRARSAEPGRVLDAIRGLIDEGHHEVVLTGVHLGTYGVHLIPQTSFSELVHQILDLPGLGRLRLSCIEPMAFPFDLVERARDDVRLAPHFHLPLQSGSDAILKRMVRPYRSRDFIGLLHDVRSRLPEACLGTDVIVGFPGESERDFEHTISTLEAADLDYVHVFSYSDREGTPSTRLSPKVEPGVIKRRCQVLTALSAKRWKVFLHRRVGKLVDAVSLEARSGPDQMQALGADYTPFDVPVSSVPPNRPLRIRVESVAGRRCRGRVA